MSGSASRGLTDPRRQSVASATVITYGTQLTVALLSLANVLITSRYLGPSGRGNVAFLTAMAWVTSSLATAGVEESNANLAASDPHLRRSLAANSIVLAVLLGLLAAGLVAGLIQIFPAVGGDSSAALISLTLSFLPVLILGLYLRFLVRADYAFAVTNIALLVTPIANVALNGLLALLGLLTVGTAVTTWLGGQAAATAILVWYVARRLAGFGRPDLGLMKRALTFGLKSHAGRVMLLGNLRLDQWILGAISGARELGLYSVAVAWAEALFYLPTALAFVQRPDLVRSGRREAARQAGASFRVAMVVTVVLGLGMFFAAPFLCATLFGGEFQGSIVELRVLILGAVGVLALKVFGSALVAQRKPVLSSIALGTGFILTVGLDVLLIPPYAGIGAAVASTLAYTAAGAVMVTFVVKALDAKVGDLVPRRGDVQWVVKNVRSRRLFRPPPAGESGGVVADLETPETG
jgi:O-antigen/teichoic acid export membrane protein